MLEETLSGTGVISQNKSVNTCTCQIMKNMGEKKQQQIK